MRERAVKQPFWPDITTSAPGKLICSGEHAVVHGAPALALSIDRYITLMLGQFNRPGVLLDLPVVGYSQYLAVDQLSEIYEAISHRYQAFREGELPIEQVLETPAQLIIYTVVRCAAVFKVDLSEGFRIRVASGIPIGCGMGSSAAGIVACCAAFAAYADVTLPAEEFLALATSIESLQHGRASGLDVHLSYLGGATVFEGGVLNYHAEQALEIPDFHIVQTGRPSVTTGACVAQSRLAFEADAGLVQAFSDVSERMLAALQQHNHADLCVSIRENHRLLQQIGVVPERVERFIRAIEALGGAAKVCGAGASFGDAAGVVWAYGISGQELAALALSYDYAVFDIKPTRGGVETLSLVSECA